MHTENIKIKLNIFFRKSITELKKIINSMWCVLNSIQYSIPIKSNFLSIISILLKTEHLEVYITGGK